MLQECFIFTVFENGERVTFEITDEMYEAMKPRSKAMSYRNKVLNTASSLHRAVLTQYNPMFSATNAIKDAQDILINSQHPLRTYLRMPQAYMEMASNGKWYTEYVEHGGEQNTYFDRESKTFKEDSAIKKVAGFPLKLISEVNDFIEMAPRLAEYIESRKEGRSIERSMLDAARVTTNFAAGGEVTKFINGNGCTFFSASVNGAVQQVRNFREAKSKGLAGWAGLAGRFALAGLPALVLNNLLWEDDEEYEELSDYVKQGYYVVGKTEEGRFIRIPKGRTVAVIQGAIDQVMAMSSGDDEADLGEFMKLVVDNIAPNNPIDNNIIAPIIQAAKNTTWYGEDLVPSRLQKVPEAEQ